MANDLKVYNHLNYKEQPFEKEDGFVEFLFQHSNMDAPEVNEDAAWNALNKKVYNPNKAFAWMKIAAAVAVLAVLTLSVYLYNPEPSQIHVASNTEKLSVTFPDGSLGVLNVGSSFTYLEEFGDERNVSFTGEAYFDIQKSEKPFIIDVNGVNVKVLGTAFNLVTTEKDVKLYVDRGLVAFEKDGDLTEVPAGMEAIFNRSDASVQFNNIPSENIMSWRNGVFKFDKTPLSKALNELSEYISTLKDHREKKEAESKVEVEKHSWPYPDTKKQI